MGTEKKQASLAAVAVIEAVILIITGLIMYSANLKTAEQHQNDRLECIASSLTSSYASDNYSAFMDYYSDKMEHTASAVAYLVSLDDSVDAGNIGSLAARFGVDDIVMGAAPETDDTDAMGTFWFTSENINGVQVSVKVENPGLVDLSDDRARMAYEFIDEAGTDCTFLVMDPSAEELLLCPGYSADDPQTLSSVGFDPSSIPAGTYGRITIGGVKYYAYNFSDPDAGVNAVVGVMEDMLSRNALSAAGLMVLIMAVILAMITAFSYYTAQEDRMRLRSGSKKEDTTSRKIVTAGIASVVAIAIAAFCVQTLFSISITSAMISAGHSIVSEKEFRNQMDEEGITKAFDDLCSSQTGIASYALTKHPEFRTKEGISDLSHRLGLEFIILMNRSGREIMSDSTLTGYSLPKNAKGTNGYAFGFNDLLQGARYRSVDLDADVFGMPVKLSGMPVFNGNNETDGLVLTAGSSEVVNGMLADDDIEGILNSSSLPFYMSALALNSETHDLVFPDFQYISSAYDYGLKDEHIQDNYWGSMELAGVKIYSGTKMYGNDILLLSQSYNEMFGGRKTMTSLAVFLYLLELFLMWLYFRVYGIREISRDESGNYIYIETVSGEVKSTRRVLDRVFGTGLSSDSYSGEKTTQVWRIAQLVIAAVVALIFIFRRRFAYTNSLFGFIVEGKWERGPNVFAFTVILTVIMLYLVVMWVFDSVMQGLINLANPKNETFLRLIRSFIRYISVFLMIFYCMTLAGVDSTAILASAGILTLIIGLGAQSLITDILAGLFIIFEHDFQVGDIIEINGFRGRVIEIGIRSTRIMDFQQNIKTINNRNLTDFINRTRRSTYFDITIPVKPDQDIAAIEKMLQEELPKLSEASPHIISGPVYNGIERVTTFHMYLSFRTQCSEEHRYSTMTLMNREITRLFREHGFTIGSGIK